MKDENWHHHDHGHDDVKHDAKLNPEHLKTLIPYLQKHNLDHIEDLKKWQLQAMDAGFDDIADELGGVIELSKKIDYHFRSALDIIEQLG